LSAPATLRPHLSIRLAPQPTHIRRLELHSLAFCSCLVVPLYLYKEFLVCLHPNPLPTRGPDISLASILTFTLESPTLATAMTSFTISDSQLDELKGQAAVITGRTPCSYILYSPLTHSRSIFRHRARNPPKNHQAWRQGLC
jgi:hypothetical protein